MDTSSVNYIIQSSVNGMPWTDEVKIDPYKFGDNDAREQYERYVEENENENTEFRLIFSNIQVMLKD